MGRMKPTMKPTLTAALILVSSLSSAKEQVPPTLKSVLLEQLKTTHNSQDWFVPVMKAVEGLTAEQATWKESKENHSIAQLVNHLTFWNRQQLAKFRGEKPPAYSGNNEETFVTSPDKAGWEAAVRQLDEVLTDWEKAIEGGDEAKLQS